MEGQTQQGLTISAPHPASHYVYPKQTCEVCGKEYEPLATGTNITVYEGSVGDAGGDKESLLACYRCFIGVFRAAKADKPVMVNGEST